VVNNSGAAQTVDEVIDINVAKVHLVGDGNTTLKPTSSGSPTVTASAIGCHIEGFNVETHTVGNDNAVVITANECEIHAIKIPYCRGSGLVINGADDAAIHHVILRNPGVGGNGHGIQITGASTGNRVHDFDILGAAGDGINLNGAGVRDNTIYAGDGTSVIHEGAGWGIREQGGADHNEIVGPKLLVVQNDLGNFSLNTNSTNENTTQFAKHSIATEARLSELDAANIPADVDTLTSRIGVPANIDTGGATIADNIKKIADDNGGASFDATTDSLIKIAAGSAPTAGEVADAVWDEDLSGHLTAGTSGKALSDASTGGTLQDWDAEGA
jgi:hypothetical protein